MIWECDGKQYEKKELIRLYHYVYDEEAKEYHFEIYQVALKCISGMEAKKGEVLANLMNNFIDGLLDMKIGDSKETNNKIIKRIQ